MTTFPDWGTLADCDELAQMGWTDDEAAEMAYEAELTGDSAAMRGDDRLASDWYAFAARIHHVYPTAPTLRP